MTPNARVETITPNMARQLLEKNSMNRPFNQNNLDALKKEINNNNYFLTGESIKIAKDGTLLDGQHRLRAILETGKAVKIFVIRDLETEAFKYMDTGRPRQAGDVLAIEGIKNPMKIASIAKFIIGYNKDKTFNSAIRGNADKGSRRITNADVSDFVNKNLNSLVDSYEFGYGKGRKLIQGKLVASMHYVLKKIDPMQADGFIEALVTGTGLIKGHPIHQLRDIFIHDNRSTKKLPTRAKVHLIIRAWNLVRTKKTVSNLKYDKRDPFPKPL
jgi:hypothetical protein